MSIIPKLATSLDRRDEVPNQELAASISASADRAAVAELATNLTNKHKGIRHDCIKTLYEIGYRTPELIAPHIEAFLELLASRDNRMQWGGMTALACIAKVDAAKLFVALPRLVEAADSGSVITRDHFVNILIELLSHKKYAHEAFVQLTRQLATCPTNQLAMYAEKAAGSIPPDRIESFAATLSTRLVEIPKESLRKRIERVLSKLAR